ncbi:MAG: hypothetical protein IJJ26_08360 [Victivallales bacterium]|nr:hypothetical protein [Victivallales bacterium]
MKKHNIDRMQGIVRGTFCIACILLAAEAFAQPAATQEEYDKRAKVLKVRKKMEVERDLALRTESQLSSLEARVAAVPRLSDGDAQLRTYLALRSEVKEMLGLMETTTSRQVEILGNADSVASAGDLLPQTGAYLEEIRSELQAMGVKQKSQRARLVEISRVVELGIKNVPPPERFRNGAGQEMRLVRSGGQSFYISLEPVAGSEGMTFAQAQALVAKLAQREKSPYHLPTRKELVLLERLKLFPSCAIWSADQWKPSDTEEQRQQERFGIVKYLVWDPRRVLGRKASFGELPQASYPKLGVYVVTSVQAGTRIRWASLAKEGKP